MQVDRTDPAEEIPSLLWGLDPVFTAFARLFVKDILHMKESSQVPGIYFYKSHPIFKVDVLGTVVYKREKEDFFCYGVDDGTGVICCLCWKNEQWRDRADAKPLASLHGGFNPVEQLEKLLQAQRDSSHLEIGELLRVRGLLKTSRDQREIMAHTFYKVADPVLSEQIGWMMELPQLYRDCYDTACWLPSNQEANNDDAPTSFSRLLGQATQTMRDFLREKNVARFRPYDVERLLLPLVAAPPEEPTTELLPCQQTRQLLQESLKVLQDEGLIYRKVRSQDEVYNVTERDADLRMAVLDIVRVDSRREKYREKGCHLLHILSCARHRYSQNLSRAALELLLASLERESDIVSTADSCYTTL